MLGLLACPYFDARLLAFGLSLLSLGATAHGYSFPAGHLLRHLRACRAVCAA